MKKLSRTFYRRSALLVAPALLGKLIVHRTRNHYMIGRIVEVEAYMGARDPASHAYRGKTRRNEVMFGEGGHLYVYFTYGMHFCANVVTAPFGRAEAVLLRGVEPLVGIETMARYRYGGRVRTVQHLEHLSRGPARFCQAFGLGRKQNGIDLLGNEVFIAGGRLKRSEVVARSPRIGVTTGKEKRWRFFIRGNRWVSRRPSKA